MPELNRVERRALSITAALVVLGTAVRLGFFARETTLEWRPAPAGGGASLPDLDQTRRAVREGIERVRRASRPLATGERIDPNTAPAEELERLPGIGPVRARAIMSAREEEGPFLGISDLARVPGIGQATVDRLRPFLAPDASGSRKARSAAPELLDVNRANRADLERLAGVGPARAARIVEYRGRHGPFRSLRELLKVPGIGPATLEALQGQLVVKQ